MEDFSAFAADLLVLFNSCASSLLCFSFAGIFVVLGGSVEAETSQFHHH